MCRNLYKESALQAMLTGVMAVGVLTVSAPDRPEEPGSAVLAHLRDCARCAVPEAADLAARCPELAKVQAAAMAGWTPGR